MWHFFNLKHSLFCWKRLKLKNNNGKLKCSKINYEISFQNILIIAQSKSGRNNKNCTKVLLESLNIKKDKYNGFLSFNLFPFLSKIKIFLSQTNSLFSCKYLTNTNKQTRIFFLLKLVYNLYVDVERPNSF